MKRHLLLLAPLLTIITGCVKPTLSTPTATPTVTETPAPTAAMEAEAYHKASIPGEAHKILEGMIGSWTTDGEITLGPGMKPVRTSGVSTIMPLLGGRFVKQWFESTDEKMPMEGLGITGFNNLTGRYESVWMDSMMTSIYWEEGAYDPATKRLTMEGKSVDPVSKQPKPTRSVITFESPERFTVEMFERLPNGEELKGVAIAFTKTSGCPAFGNRGAHGEAMADCPHQRHADCSRKSGKGCKSGEEGADRSRFHPKAECCMAHGKGKGGDDGCPAHRGKGKGRP